METTEGTPPLQSLSISFDKTKENPFCSAKGTRFSVTVPSHVTNVTSINIWAILRKNVIIYLFWENHLYQLLPGLMYTNCKSWLLKFNLLVHYDIFGKVVTCQ